VSRAITIRIGDPDAKVRFMAIFDSGGVAIVPCDTIYGLVGRVPDAEARIRLIKGRGDDKPFLLLIPEPGLCSEFSPMPVPPSLACFWPGPLTVILPGHGGATVALRVPDSPFLRESMRAAGRALYSTSVNRTGHPSLFRQDDIVSEFSQDVDLILTAGDMPGRLASTVVDATSTPFRIVRQGALELPADLLR
jgi:L-threonylcarbamoyladenylate synthase